MNRAVLVVGIVFLFIFSIITPVVISINEPVERDEYLDDLAHVNYDEYCPFEVDNYEQMYQSDFFDSDESQVISDTFYLMEKGVFVGPMDSAWPMKCHDNRHTGQSPYSTADNPYNEKWRFKTESWVEGSIIIDDEGCVYFGSFDWFLYALNPDGTLKWKYKTGGSIWSTPAIDEDGTIYIGTWDDYLYAINPNGTLRWNFKSNGDISSSPAIGEDGTIYFGNFGYKVYAINANGTEKWCYETDYHITSDPAIGDDGTIYIGSGDGYLYALYPNGTLRWRFETGHYVKGPPSVAEDGTIYIGSFDDFLYAIYPNGTERWRCGIDWGTETNPSIGSDGTVYVGGKYLYAINPDGTMKWVFDLGADRYIRQSSPAISAEGTIYIGTNIGVAGGGEIIAVNPDGSERWRERIATEWVDSSPVIAEDGTIYIGSSNNEEVWPGSWDSVGYLHAFGELDPDAPGAPTITGETEGAAGEEYEYTFCSNDPNGDDVFYNIEWGDGEFEDWFGPFASGEEVVVNHTWDDRGTYIVRARAKDTDNLWGPWGELEVTMPVNQQSTYPLFLRFLDRFPNTFPILRQIFGL